MSDTLEGAVKGQDIVFIAVTTLHDLSMMEKHLSFPSNKDFDYRFIKQVLSEVNAVATKDQISSPRLRPIGTSKKRVY